MTVHTLVTALPDPEILRARCRALALLDSRPGKRRDPARSIRSDGIS
ncbi:hypothetical protein ACWEJQ_05395 [Streptomyces albidoflavus]